MYGLPCLLTHIWFSAKGTCACTVQWEWVEHLKVLRKDCFTGFSHLYAQREQPLGVQTKEEMLLRRQEVVLLHARAIQRGASTL